jgi:hypothetical protein
MEQSGLVVADHLNLKFNRTMSRLPRNPFSTVIPYAIYYRVLPNHIRILAFKHHSRHPDYWRHRLSK